MRKTKCLTYGEPINQWGTTFDMNGGRGHVSFATYKTLCGYPDEDNNSIMPPDVRKRPKGICPKCWKQSKEDEAESTARSIHAETIEFLKRSNDESV